MDAKPKILVVDDDPDILHMTRQLLEQAGYQVRTASNTIGAGYLLADFQPDLVVLDIMLPGSLSGDQACSALCELRPGIKIVFFSGIEEGELQRLGRSCAADAVLAKGVRPSALRRAVDELLGRERR